MECKGCNAGIKMCHHRPCFGTPEEFEKIIDAGFADKLRIDYYLGKPEINFDELFEELEKKSDSEDLIKALKSLKELQDLNPNPHKKDVLMLSGGTNKDVNYKANFWPTGSCKLLENDLCILHDLNLKPEQGRESCCDETKDTSKNNLHYANLWNTEKGKEVIEKFKKAINYVDK